MTNLHSHLVSCRFSGGESSLVELLQAEYEEDLNCGDELNSRLFAVFHSVLFGLCSVSCIKLHRAVLFFMSMDQPQQKSYYSYRLGVPPPLCVMYFARVCTYCNAGVLILYQSI